MRLTLISIAMMASLNYSAQDLEYGVPTEVELFSDGILFSFCDEWIAGNGWQSLNQYIYLTPNIFPYASGMSLTFHVDSLSGPIDSLYNPNTGDFVQIPAAIPVSSPISFQIDTIADYGSTTMYYRLVATGTPSVLNEPYHCSYDAIWEWETCDPCACMTQYWSIHAGDGWNDTSPDCMVTMPTSNEELQLETIEVYPNPANKQLNIDLGGFAGSFTIQLISMDGRLVKEDQLQGGATRTLDIATCSAGLYSVVVQNKDLVSQSKLVVE